MSHCKIYPLLLTIALMGLPWHILIISVMYVWSRQFDEAPYWNKVLVVARI